MLADPDPSTITILTKTQKSGENILPSFIEANSDDVTNNQHAKSNDLSMLWSMRWCFFWVGSILCILWMITTMTASIVVFYVTKSYSSFLISLGPAISIQFMRWFASYLLPMDEKRFQLEKMKIEMKRENRKVKNFIVDK